MHKFIVIFLMLFLFTGTASAVENQILIAVAAENIEVTSQISAIAARAPYFLLFDEHSKLVQTVQNPAANASGGAGPRAADFLAEQKVTLVIAGQFGQKMAAALKSHSIQTVEQQGPVIDGVKEQNHVQK